MPKQTLSKTEKILKSEDFLSIRKSGKRYRTEKFIFYVLPTDLSTVRLGMAVSTAVSKKAVERNKIKRWIREFFRTHKEVFPTSTDIVVNVKRGSVFKNYKEIEKEFEDFLKDQK